MRRPRFDSVQDLPERYRQQVATMDARRTGRPRPSSSTTRDGVPFRRCPHPSCPEHGCVEPGSWQLLLPGRPLTTNRFISPLFIGRDDVRAARTAEVGRSYRQWKEAGYVAAMGERIPRLVCGWVRIQALYASPRSMADAGGVTVVGKAIVDGLVQAGVLADDRPGMLSGEVYPEPAVDTRGDGVLVTVFSGALPGLM